MMAKRLTVLEMPEDEMVEPAAAPPAAVSKLQEPTVAHENSADHPAAPYPGCTSQGDYGAAVDQGSFGLGRTLGADEYADRCTEAEHPRRGARRVSAGARLLTSASLSLVSKVELWNLASQGEPQRIA